jgi:hypothetical protein
VVLKACDLSTLHVEDDGASGRPEINNAVVVASLYAIDEAYASYQKTEYESSRPRSISMVFDARKSE